MPTANSPKGKNQNKLRPEDIEKIDFVFTQKRELPKYSRLVDKTEIVDKHDYNLNIRRYVDNTPDPEPEDVQAHLIGGVPEAEVEARHSDFAKFGVTADTLFQPERPGYLAFLHSHRCQARHQDHAGIRCRAAKDTSPPTTKRWKPGGVWPAMTLPSFAMAKKCRKSATNCSPP